jgi:hypothetical protein
MTFPSSDSLPLILSLQQHLLTLSASSLPHFLLFCESSFPSSSSLFAHSITVAAQFLPRNIPLYARAITTLSARFPLKSSLSRSLRSRFRSAAIFSCHNSLFSFLYELSLTKFYSSSEIVSICCDLFPRISLYSDIISGLFSWFAPEIESETPAAYFDLLYAFRRHAVAIPTSPALFF